MEISTVVSAVEGAIHLAIDVPILAIGVIIGAVGYAFVAKRYPALTASLVAKASAEVQSLVSAELAKVAAAKTAASNIAATTASAGTNSGTTSK
jgi:hypothetical protein